MSFETLHNVHRARFDTQVAVPNGYLVVYDNRTIDVPEDSLWLQWSVIEGARTKVQQGEGAGGTFRTSGVCKANIFMPIEKGDREALEAADFIKTSFQAVTDSGVVYRAPYIGSGRREGKWWIVTVTCPWFFDEIT